MRTENYSSTAISDSVFHRPTSVSYTSKHLHYNVPILLLISIYISNITAPFHSPKTFPSPSFLPQEQKWCIFLMRMRLVCHTFLPYNNITQNSIVYLEGQIRNSWKFAANCAMCALGRSNFGNYFLSFHNIQGPINFIFS